MVGINMWLDNNTDCIRLSIDDQMESTQDMTQSRRAVTVCATNNLGEMIDIIDDEIKLEFHVN